MSVYLSDFYCKNSACWRSIDDRSLAWTGSDEGSVEIRSHPNDFTVGASRDGHSIRVGVDVYSDAQTQFVRGVALRNVGAVGRCLQRAGDAVRPGRLAVRFVANEAGDVLGVGVASSTLAAPAVDDCVAETIRRWRFAMVFDAHPIIAVVPFIIR